MKNDGYCSFIIKGHGLNFDEIENTLKIKASKKFIEGEVISKVIGKNEFDIIRFDWNIDEEKSPNETINSLMDKILPALSYIQNIQKRFDVYVKCFVQSDNAQINYKVSPEVMGKMAILNVDFEFSALSWGGAEED